MNYPEFKQDRAPTQEETIELMKVAAENGRKDAVWLTAPMTYSQYCENYQRVDCRVTCFEYMNYLTAACKMANRDYLLVA